MGMILTKGAWLAAEVIGKCLATGESAAPVIDAQGEFGSCSAGMESASAWHPVHLSVMPRFCRRSLREEPAF